MTDADGTPLELAEAALELDREALVELVTEMLTMCIANPDLAQQPGMADWLSEAKEVLASEREHREAAYSVEAASGWYRAKKLATA